MIIKAAELILRNDAIRWKILTSKNVTIRIFTPALTVTKTLTFQMFHLENVDQDHRVQHT